jgi:hypothetical protein
MLTTFLTADAVVMRLTTFPTLPARAFILCIIAFIAATTVVSLSLADTTLIWVIRCRVRLISSRTVPCFYKSFFHICS